MPEFHLNTGDSDRHAAFDALPSIAQGYFEAAFFTGVCGLIPDPDGEILLCDGTRAESLEIDGLGIGNLDAESFRDMATDACRFWIENAETLETATASGAYDLEQAGRDLWFSRNGHGVGFFDRDLGEAGDALQSAAQYREIDLSAEPLDPADPDPDDSEAWRVVMDQRVDPLDRIDRAALEALERGADAQTVSREIDRARKPAPDWIAERGEGEQYRRNVESFAVAALEALEPSRGALPVADPLGAVGSRFGAPMGRNGAPLDPDAEAVTLRRVTLDPGGYDSGGAYWGIGEPLWRAMDPEGGAVYFRAQSRADALETLRREHGIAGGLANGI